MTDLPMMVACAVALFGSGLFAYRHYLQPSRHEHEQHQDVVFFLAFVAALTALSVLTDPAIANW